MQPPSWLGLQRYWFLEIISAGLVPQEGSVSAEIGTFMGAMSLSPNENMRPVLPARNRKAIESRVAASILRLENVLLM